jgi:outer membrane receptor protein involved in Fe transport
MKSAISALLLLLVSTQAFGGEPASPRPASGEADEAQFHFVRGNRAYQERRFEDALASYYLSNRLVPNRNVQFNIARCLDRLARYEEAYRAWSALNTSALPESEAKTVRDAIDQLRPHLALVEVESSPPGATIYAGRRDLGALGTTPQSLALRPASTKIILDRPGFRAVELPAAPVLGQTVKVTATLERIHGTIEIRRAPANAEIRRDLVDGELLRVGPGPITVIPGPLILFVSAPGFQAESIRVDAVPDAMVPVDVLLSPAIAPTGTLVLRSNIVRALIRVDGQEAGFTPTVIDGIPTGRRQIEVVAEGRRTFSETVEIKRGERTFIDAYLGRADPEVTAATKSAIASESAPASVSIVTADEIAAFGYTTLTEALVGIRGIFTSNDRSYESVGFRGFSPPGDYTNRVLVLVDGHPINDAVSGQGYVGHDLDVDLGNVARIEIVRGPGSVLYGTGAVFGVINVVTRQAIEGPHADISTMAGTSGLASGRATASARSGNASLMVSAAALRSDGDKRYVWPTDLNNSTPVTVLDADGERAAHASLVGRWGDLSVNAGYNDRKKTLPTGAYLTQPVAGTTNHDRRGFSELRFDHAWGDFGVSARAAYDVSWYHGNFMGSDPEVADYQDLKAQWVTGELRFELPRFWLQHFTIGGQVVDQLQMDISPIDTAFTIPKDFIVSAYIVDDIRLSQRLSINIGLRSDNYTKTIGNTLVPRLAILGKPYARGNTKLFVGRSFRAPSPDERASTLNGHLGPETMWSGEIEHAHAVSDDVQIIASVFASVLYGLVDLDPAASPDNPYDINNPNRIRGMGAEAELRWEPGGGTLVSVSATRQRVQELGPAGNTPFINAPETMFKARILCPLVGAALRLGSELVLDSGRHFRGEGGDTATLVDDSVLWNVSMSGEYRAWRLRYFVGLFNLLDIRDDRAGFPTARNYPLPLVSRYGRSLRVGLSLAL